MSELQRAPFGIVRPDVKKEVVDKSDTIDRFWKSKETGVTVQVTQYQRVQPEGKRRVVFLDPTIGVNASCSFDDFERDFYPVGNLTDKF